jgi:hypothetical protein
VSIFGWILGGDKIKEKIVDGIYNGADNLVYTEQEKKANHAVFLALYEPFKVAQRYLSIIFSVPFVILHTAAFSSRLALWNDEALQTSIKLIQGDLNESLGLIVLTIVGFYFAGGVVEGGIKAFKSK